MVRIAGKAQTFETVIALPDSTRFMYIGITGSHCNFTGINITKSEDECSEDYIPRIAEAVSYIKHGVEKVFASQPFGCMVNHCAGRGLYPSLTRKLKKL